MARRTLELLLSRAPLGDSTEFRSVIEPVQGESTRSPKRPTFKWVLHLLNLWLALRSLFSWIVPFAKEQGGSLIELEGKDASEGSKRAQKIDWPATLGQLAAGGQGVVLKSVRRTREEKNREYLALVLEEALIHAQHLLQTLSPRRKQLAKPLVGMLDDLETYTEEIDRLLIGRLKPFRATAEATDEIERLHRVELESETSALFIDYRERTSSLVGVGPRQFAINEVTQRLGNWRRQYLEGEVWLSDLAGFELSVGSEHGLYELWCFSELAAMANSLAAESIVQSSFLRRGKESPAFALGNERYVFYDFGECAFKAITVGEVFEQDLPYRPVLPKAHVEWFIRDIRDFRNSMVIDTKLYSEWDSGQALKVLGYMQNFGVRQGAVIFPCELDALTDWAQEVVPGLFRLPFPGEAGAALWVLQMEPTPGAEPRNASVMKNFIEQAIFGGDSRPR